MTRAAPLGPGWRCWRYFPTDLAAFEAAERLLRQTGDQGRLGTLLAWAAAREGEPRARSQALWRLAEFRRADAPATHARLAPLSRDSRAAARAWRHRARQRWASPFRFKFKDEDWQRRDDLLAVHTARALAAPTAEEAARAVADRAELLMAARVGRLDEAERDLARALELAPAAAEVIGALERLHERRGDLPGLRQRLTALVARATSGGTGQLWQGIGRTNEALGDVDAARVAYQRAMTADTTLRAPLSALRRLAAAQSDWPEVARLLEMELAMDPPVAERVVLLTELGVVSFTHLDGAARAVEALDAALLLDPANSTALDAMFGAALAVGAVGESHAGAGGAAGRGSGAGRHLTAVLPAGTGRGEGGAGRSRPRPVFAVICPQPHLSSHVWNGCRRSASNASSGKMPGRPPSISSNATAPIWTARPEPSCPCVRHWRIFTWPSGWWPPIASLPCSMGPPHRRACEMSPRAGRQCASSEDCWRAWMATAKHACSRVCQRCWRLPARPRAIPRGPWRARRWRRWRWWTVAGPTLCPCWMGWGQTRALEARRRCLYLVAAGDILLHQHGDVAAAALQYQRARALNPAEQRLARPGVIQMGQGDPGGAEEWRPRRGSS